MSSPSSQTYFAARSRTEIGKFLMTKLEDCVSEDKSGIRVEYSNAYDHLYGSDAGLGPTSAVTRGGSEGERALVRVNRARALANAYVAMVTGPKMAWRPQARNGDAGATKATSLALNILEDEWKRARMNRHVYRWVDQTFAFSEALSFPKWDLSKGPPLAAVKDPYTGADRLKRAGDITYHNILPWHFFRDPALRSAQQNPWWCVRLLENRWDLEALIPKTIDGKWTRDQIGSAFTAKTQIPGAALSEKSDFVWVYYFFHEPTPSLPMGREVVLVSDSCVLKDSVLSYGRKQEPEVPLIRLAVTDQHDTAHGWTPFWDTLGVQELMDSLDSAISTNLTAFGTQTIAVAKGSEFSAADVVAGMRVVRAPPNMKADDAVAAVQLAKSPPEIFGYLRDKASDQRTIVGLNDVALGQPQSAQMNAQAFAVLASMAQQQTSPFQAQVVDAVAQLGSVVLRIKARYVTIARKLQITGKSSSHLYTEETYLGTDVEPADQTQVDIGNALEQSPAGRVMLLQMMMGMPGVITEPEQVTQVIETGRVESATRARRDELMLISSEYEQLSQGQNPPVHYTQNHPLHFKENSSALQNAAALKSPEIIQAVEAHLDQHYLEQFGIPRQQDQMRTVRERWMLGQAIDPTQMMPPPGAGGPPPPGGPPGPDQGPPGAPPPGPPPPGADAALAPPSTPGPNVPPVQMPQNPLTGQQFNQLNGGGVVPM